MQIEALLKSDSYGQSFYTNPKVTFSTNFIKKDIEFIPYGYISTATLGKAQRELFKVDLLKSISDGSKDSKTLEFNLSKLERILDEPGFVSTFMPEPPGFMRGVSQYNDALYQFTHGITPHRFSSNRPLLFSKGAIVDAQTNKILVQLVFHRDFSKYIGYCKFYNERVDPNIFELWVDEEFADTQGIYKTARARIRKDLITPLNEEIPVKVTTNIKGQLYENSTLPQNIKSIGTLSDYTESIKQSYKEKLAIEQNLADKSIYIKPN